MLFSLVVSLLSATDYDALPALRIIKPCPLPVGEYAHYLIYDLIYALLYPENFSGKRK